MKFHISSQLEISRDEVLGLLTMADVNAELLPLVRMTTPSEWAKRPIYEWPVGQVLFSSWILLFGFIPVDRHTFYLQSIDRHRGFVEESSSLTNKIWRHRRDFEWEGERCRVTDTLEFQCRLSFLGYLLAPVYRFIFRHRHKMLRLSVLGPSVK